MQNNHNLKSTKFILAAVTLFLVIVLSTGLLVMDKLSSEQWVASIEYLVPFALIVYGFGNVLSKGIVLLATRGQKLEDDQGDKNG